ncbi:MAG TPA: guanylate kinase [Clostridia bacterium]|nr:guanylate kinase [Clostridia bacterium]
MVEKRGILLVISGPSGVGKGTVCNEIMKLRNDLFLSVSATTRIPRPGEAHGINYFFMTREEFLERCERGEFLEWAKVYGNFYGTPRDAVKEAIEEGRNVVLEIDIQGALRVKEKIPEAVLVFIAPPSYEELKKRLVNRDTDKEEIISERLRSLGDEISYIKNYDYVVINDTVGEAVQKINSIIKAEKCRGRFYTAFNA